MILTPRRRCSSICVDFTDELALDDPIVTVDPDVLLCNTQKFFNISDLRPCADEEQRCVPCFWYGRYWVQATAVGYGTVVINV